MIKVGLVGCGLMGTLHARTLHSLPGVEVVALQNRTRAKAEQLSHELGGPAVYDRYEDLLEHDLDAVWVATPDHLHVEISKAVLESGRHLFLEKILATTMEDGQEIVEAGEKHSHLKSMVAYPLRFDPAYRKMQEVASSEGAGRPLQAWSLRTHFLEPQSKVYDKYRDHFYDTPNWYFDGAESKGPIFSHGSHDYDLLQWMCGDVESVFAYGDSYMLPKGSVADGFVVALRFKSGAVAQVSTPWITRVEYDMTGLALENVTVVNNNSEVRIKEKDEPEQRITFTENNMWTGLNGHFLECIREDKKPLISLNDGLRDMAVAEAAYRSLQERREVFVSELYK